MRAGLRRFIRDDAGATSIEYALIATFIALVIIASVTATGNNVANVFNNVQNGL
jgi:pilus assembly protein Flp/PilA